jgi:hypothetical protein
VLFRRPSAAQRASSVRRRLSLALAKPSSAIRAPTSRVVQVMLGQKVLRLAWLPLLVLLVLALAGCSNGGY